MKLNLLTQINSLLRKKLLPEYGLIGFKEGYRKPRLIQSCYILQKKGRYYIVHFKQLFLLDGKQCKTYFSEDDLERTKDIALLLSRWNIVKLISPITLQGNHSEIVVIPYQDKNKFTLISKYSIGKIK